MSERSRAERCFALARSTTFPGERESAISRGTAIAQKAGLSLDEFDIPGRERKAPSARLFEGSRTSGFRYTHFFDLDPDEVMKEVDRLLRENARRQERDLASERARRAHQLKVDFAVDFLRSRGVRIERSTTALGYIYSLDDGTSGDGDYVIATARARGWGQR